MIDPEAASIDSITIGSDPGTDQTYAGGDAIDLVLNYDKDVTVDTTNGTPSIRFEVGRGTRTASYVSGSGTSALTFRYTVVTGPDPFFVAILRLLGRRSPPAGDEDEDGIRVPAGNVALNGGVIEGRREQGRRTSRIRNSPRSPDTWWMAFSPMWNRLTRARTAPPSA